MPDRNRLLWESIRRALLLIIAGLDKWFGIERKEVA